MPLKNTHDHKGFFQDVPAKPVIILKAYRLKEKDK
jgi:hypothetical protein